MLITLILGALTVVYALIFFSGSLADTYKLYAIGGEYTKQSTSILDDNNVTYKIGGVNFYNTAQNFNDVLFVVSIIYLLVTVTLYITSCNKNRNYYISNYVSICLVTVCAVVFAIFSFVEISVCLNAFKTDIDWTVLKEASEASYDSASNSYDIVCNDSVTMFAIGYVLFALILVNAATLVLNLVWKIKLMKGEKALLSNGLVKEVA